MYNVKLLVALSGHVGSGKTTLAKKLVDRYRFRRLSTGDLLIQKAPDVAKDRKSLQELGERLDKETGETWVRDGVGVFLRDISGVDSVVVDSIRTLKQLEELRRSFGDSVIHVHLACPTDELERRYKNRRREDLDELSSFQEVLENETERNVDLLEDDADLLVQSNISDEEDVLVRTAGCLGLHGRECQSLVDVLVGGQYGSEGKGQVAAYLSREYEYLVRVGGPNAGHKVYFDGSSYTFHHLPSGTRSSQAKIVVGPGASLRVDRLLAEIADCGLTTDRLMIDPNAICILERYIKEEERTLKGAIGSTAQGVGVAAIERIRGRRGGARKPQFASQNKLLKPYIRCTREVLDEAYRRQHRVLLEGTQGTELSLYHGQYPYVTSRDTTVSGCLSEAGISPRRVRRIILVLRTYPIRVQSPEKGTSGALKREIELEEVARRSGINLDELRKTETTSTTKRKRRIGEFDWSLLRKAVSLNAPTDIALTFADYLSVKNQSARRFDQLEPSTIRFIDEVERVACAPVTLISTRFHSRAIIDRREWR